MPRNGSGVYSAPAGTTAITQTTIDSTRYNALVADLVTDANTARPVVAGGTGATSAAAALVSLGAAAAFETVVAAKANTTWVDGRTYNVAGVDYTWTDADVSASVTASDPRYLAPDSDATGASGALVLNSPYIAHAGQIGVVTGTVADAVALANAQKINAWLAGADARVFDWRGDEIGIGETIRLGRDGNGVTGISGAMVFGTASTGARALWQGASGGRMFLMSRADGSLLHSPTIFGVSANGNGLAQVGFAWEGAMKPQGDALHVSNLLDSSASYAYIFRHNPVASGFSNTCFGGRFGNLTCSVTGSANGFLFTGRSASPGEAITFCQFSYCHVTCANGFSFVFQKGDDNVFSQIGVSRAAGGTGGQVLFNSNRSLAMVWVGNVIHNMNMSKTDGSQMVISVSDDGTMGNVTTYNGVDFAPLLSLNGGSALHDNQWNFLGQSDYAGGWTTKPKMALPPLFNIESGDPVVLDWYEEGSATPQITFGGSSTGVTYSTNALQWTRIGNRVFFNGQITLTSKGSAVGQAQITGLPFPNAGSGSGVSFGYFDGFSGAITPYATLAGSNLALRKASVAAPVTMTDADFTNASRLDFSGSYRVA